MPEAPGYFDTAALSSSSNVRFPNTLYSEKHKGFCALLHYFTDNDIVKVTIVQSLRTFPSDEPPTLSTVPCSTVPPHLR